MCNLIEVLSDFINMCPRTNEFCDYSLAKAHQVSAIVSYQCKAKDKSIALQSYNHVIRERTISEIKNALSDISFVFVKGCIIQSLYPIPSLREMGDIDMLIHEEDLGKVKSILEQKGFVSAHSSIHEFAFVRGQVLVEVHTRLIHDGPGREKLIAFFDKAWDFYHNGELDWNFHFLFLLSHLRGHLLSNGVGIRQFMDIAIVEKSIHLDWDWVEDNAKQLGLYEFMTTVLALIERWFAISSPIPKRLDDPFFERATNEILSNGSFGNDNTPIRSISGLSISKQIQGKKAKRIIVFRHMFPRLNHIRQLSYCGYLIKLPFLLPFSWLHRFAYRLFNKDSIYLFREKIGSQQEEISNRIDFMHQWGL